MYEAATRNLRTAERFLLDPPLAGQFGGSPVSVTDISVKGARFRHAQPLEMGQKSVLQLAIEGRPQIANIEAVVVWTKPDPSGRAASFRECGPTRRRADRSACSRICGPRSGLRASRRCASTDRFDVLPRDRRDVECRARQIENLSARGARIETHGRACR